MRTLIIVAAALALIAGPACNASAAGYSKAQKRHAKWYLRPNVDRQRRYPDASGWYPHDANKLPIRSSIWWEQMRREGRAGRS